VIVSETDGLGTSWLGSPTFATFPNPTPLANVGGGGNAYSAEGNFAMTQPPTGNELYGNGGLAQTFSLTTGGALTDLQFGFSGGASTLGLYLFDLGSSSSYTVATGSTFTPSYNPGGDANLVPSGIQFTYNGGASGVLNVADVNFTGTGITLLANEEYAVALEPTSTPALQWSRSGSLSPNPPDQGYRYNAQTWAVDKYSAINGGIRVFSLAVTTVPEPTIMALMGAGIALSGVLIRRRKA
jgi:hypothetical protein